MRKKITTIVFFLILAFAGFGQAISTDLFNPAKIRQNVKNRRISSSDKIGGNNDVGWLGRTHLYRFFINDPIFFEKSLKGTIEHGGNNNMTLDIGSVAYRYQSEAAPLPPAPSRELRQPKPFIDMRDIHKWRHEWRKNHGNNPRLWGNE